jgi:nicotinate-nucleotide adenylyltransferase
MPARRPPHKPIAEDPGAEHRLAMCRLLLERCEGLSACPLELERDGPSYTVDTLRAIHDSHPELGLTFVVGADIACTLPAWREPAELLELAELAVAARTGTDRQEVLAAVGPLSGRADIRFLDAPVLDVSSSMARELVAGGEPIDGLVGEAVAGYVDAHGLYAARERAAS